MWFKRGVVYQLLFAFYACEFLVTVFREFEELSYSRFNGYGMALLYFMAHNPSYTRWNFLSSVTSELTLTAYLAKIIVNGELCGRAINNFNSISFPPASRPFFRSVPEWFPVHCAILSFLKLRESKSVSSEFANCPFFRPRIDARCTRFSHWEPPIGESGMFTEFPYRKCSRSR